MTNEEKTAPQEAELKAEQAVEESGGAETQEAPSHEELTLLLEDARAKADSHWDQLLRSNAELENARRRAKQDVENAHKYALEKFAQELLPVKDSLEMGLAAANSDDEAVKVLREGTELTLRMLSSALEKFGIKEIEAQGAAFNPELHQAMAMQESAEHPANTVMVVMQKGYQLNDRLLRPAMVVVSKGAPKAAENAKPGNHVDEQA